MGCDLIAILGFIRAQRPFSNGIDWAQQAFNNYKRIDLIVDYEYNGVYGLEQMQEQCFKSCIWLISVKEHTTYQQLIVTIF